MGAIRGPTSSLSPSVPPAATVAAGVAVMHVAALSPLAAAALATGRESG